MGSGLLLTGTALLTAETWNGVRATDQRVTTVMELCDADVVPVVRQARDSSGRTTQPA